MGFGPNWSLLKQIKGHSICLNLHVVSANQNIPNHLGWNCQKTLVLVEICKTHVHPMMLYKMVEPLPSTKNSHQEPLQVILYKKKRCTSLAWKPECDLDGWLFTCPPGFLVDYIKTMGFGPNWDFLSQIKGHSICLNLHVISVNQNIPNHLGWNGQKTLVFFDFLSLSLNHVYDGFKWFTGWWYFLRNHFKNKRSAGIGMDFRWDRDFFGWCRPNDAL